ncbi:MAG: hypothetical protein OXE52_00055 [Chloroflexi bacterium]|nr:hypothetical protein [Chloroflexota bacterium]
MPAQGGGGGKPAKPEPEQQPVGWWPSWLPPYIPGGGTPPEPDPEPEPEPDWTAWSPPYIPGGGGGPPDPQPEPEPEESTQTYTSPHEFADKPITSAQYERYRDEIREDARDHDKQQSPAQNSEPPGASVLQDIEWSRDIEASEPLGLLFGGKGTTDIAEDMVVGVCEGLHRVNPEGTAAFVRFTTGIEPDEEDRRTAEEMANLFRSAGFVEHFDSELRQSLRPGPRSSVGGSPFEGGYFDMAFAPGQGILRPGMRFAFATDGESSDADEPTPVETADPHAEHRPDPSTLNERTVDHLQELFPDADLKTREELQAFLQGRLAGLAPEFDDPEIGWDEFSTDDMIIFYISALKLAMEMYWLPKDPHYMSDERMAIADELGFVEDLIEKAALTPLEDLDAMLDAYGWDSKAEATYYFRHRVEVVYSKLGRELPPGWEELDDPVVMANMLYDGIGEMKSILASGDTFLAPDDPTSADWGMIHNAAGFIEMEPKMLTGTRNLGPDLTLLLFVGSLFFEPLDWVLTAADVAEALEEGDVGGAVLNAFLGLMPFVSSKTDDFIRYGADIVGGAGRAGVDFAKVGGRFTSNFNVDTHITARSIFDTLREKSEYADISDAALMRKARGRASSLNSTSIKNQLKQAVAENSEKWQDRVAVGDQQLHHIVPAGHRDAMVARQHMQSHGIFVNSAHNAVGLELKVHDLTKRKIYVQTVDKAIRNLESPEEIASFLDNLAAYLQDLNKYADKPAKLESEYARLLANIQEAY